MRIHNPDAQPSTLIAAEAVRRSPDPPRSISRAALIRANLTTTTGKTGLAFAGFGVAFAVVVAVVDNDGSRLASFLAGGIVPLLLGAVLMLVIPLRLARSVERLPAVRARVIDVSFDTDNLDTIEASVHGMAHGSALLEAHPDGTYQPAPEERRFEIDEAWAIDVTRSSTLVGLLHPRHRLIHALGLDGDAHEIEES